MSVNHFTQLSVRLFADTSRAMTDTLYSMTATERVERGPHLLLIYGPPGVGKLKVATEVAALTGFKVFHNHLTVGVVEPLFQRGSEPWVRLLRRIRQEAFVEVAREGVDVIFTCVYRGTSDEAEAVRSQLEPVRAAGGNVQFVQLTCASEELLARVQSPGRRRYAKLTDPGVLSDLMRAYDLTAVMPFRPTLQIDSTDLSPDDVAERIVAHYALPRLPAGRGRSPDASP